MTPSLFELLPRPRTLLTLGALCALALVLSSPALRTLPFNSVGALVGSKEVTFTYGGLVRNETNLSTGVSHQWLDLGDAVIDLTSNAHYFKHYDGRGNVKFLTDEAGDVVTIYNYHAYGLEEVLGDSALDPNSFAGGFRTGNTNNDPLIMGARVYDPAVGRFLSEDPLYNPLNQYAYTNGNPVNFSDPSGMLSPQFQMALGPFACCGMNNGGIAPNPSLPNGPRNPGKWGGAGTAFSGDYSVLFPPPLPPLGAPPSGTMTSPSGAVATATVIFEVVGVNAPVISLIPGLQHEQMTVIIPNPNNPREGMVYQVERTAISEGMDAPPGSFDSRNINMSVEVQVTPAQAQALLDAAASGALNAGTILTNDCHKSATSVFEATTGMPAPKMPYFHFK